MGWFDNEQEEGKPTAAAPQSTAVVPPRPAARNPSAGAETGSTLGCQIHVDGTIVCDEDLTILGRVDGTIRAKGTLVVAKEADVRAKIDGERVMVHGKVRGNVHGAEIVVLGQTGRLSGNIETPILEIIEGARFKGSVEMKSTKPEPATKPAPVSSGKPKAEVGKSEGGAVAKPTPSKADSAAVAAKPATP